MMKDGFDPTLASWLLFPERLRYIDPVGTNNMLKHELCRKNIGAIKSINQKQI